jgi:hypothetical protein
MTQFEISQDWEDGTIWLKGKENQNLMIKIIKGQENYTVVLAKGWTGFELYLPQIKIEDFTREEIIEYAKNQFSNFLEITNTFPLLTKG